MATARAEWTDDPLSGADKTRSIYIQEIQTNTNRLLGISGLGLHSWLNASVGQKFRKAHYTELQVALEDPALLSHYGYSSIADVLGHPWSALPPHGSEGGRLAGYELINDMRTVLDTIETSDLSFVFGVAWTVSQKSSLVYDETAFTFTVSAMRDGAVATDYASNCTVTSDQTSDSGNTIADVDWVDGVATVSAMEVVFSGSPTEITLTCADDATGFQTGTTTYKTQNASVITSIECTQVRTNRRGSGSNSDGRTAFDIAYAEYNADNTYDNDASGPVQKYLWFEGSYTCELYWGVSDFYASLDGFDDDDNLFALIHFSSTSLVVYSGADMFIAIPPVSDYSIQTPRDRWHSIVSQSRLLLIPWASIAGGNVLIDLGVTKSDIPAGVPIQVLMRFNVPTSYTYLWPGNPPYQGAYIVSHMSGGVDIKAY